MLILLAVLWVYEVCKIHAPQIAARYPGDTYSAAPGPEGKSLILKKDNPSWWMTGHAGVGVVVFLMWLLQATKEVRSWSYAFHRWNGRMSIVLFLSFGWYIPIAAMRMRSIEKPSTLFTNLFIAAFAVLIIAWILVGWVAIAAWKNVGLHRQCMMRVVVGTVNFIMVGRKFLSFWHFHVVDKHTWWFDTGAWLLFAWTVGTVELVPYIMEKSFQSPWEYRLFGFVKLQDRLGDYPKLLDSSHAACRPPSSPKSCGRRTDANDHEIISFTLQTHHHPELMAGKLQGQITKTDKHA